MSRGPWQQTLPAVVGSAGRLFYRYGVSAVTVDDVAAAAGRSKPTVYRHFRTKEDLVDAYLADRHTSLGADVERRLARAARGSKVRSVFEWLAEFLTDASFRGCGFVRALAETGGADPRVAERARARKTWLLERLQEAAADDCACHPARLAGQLLVLIEGATTVAYVLGTPDRAAAQAWEAADILLRADLPGSRRRPDTVRTP
jgi:AcrR family transcriptional regulator